MKKLLFSFVISFLVVSCSDNDHDNPSISELLEGKWNYIGWSYSPQQIDYLELTQEEAEVFTIAENPQTLTITVRDLTMDFPSDGFGEYTSNGELLFKTYDNLDNYKSDNPTETRILQFVWTEFEKIMGPNIGSEFDLQFEYKIIEINNELLIIQTFGIAPFEYRHYDRLMD